MQTASYNDPINITFVGVGGQGVLTASEVLARAAVLEGLDCKKSEVHGMAQRGGSVESQVRLGERVYSPLVPEGSADILVAFEKLEALRGAHLLKQGGSVILNMLEVYPLNTSSQGSGYPADIEARLGYLGLRVVAVHGQGLAEKAGDPRAAGSALLGALSLLLPFGEKTWHAAFRESFRAGLLKPNLDAFRLGRGRTPKASSRRPDTAI